MEGAKNDAVELFRSNSLAFSMKETYSCVMLFEAAQRPEKRAKKEREKRSMLRQPKMSLILENNRIKPIVRRPARRNFQLQGEPYRCM